DCRGSRLRRPVAHDPGRWCADRPFTGLLAQVKSIQDAAGDSTHAKTALEFIGKLSLIERVLWDHDQPCTPAKRRAIRQQQSAPIMAEFHTWLEALAPKVLPEGRLGKAVYYALGQWSKLSVFLTQGEVPLTNNRCENAIRPFVLGRKG